MGQGRCVGLPGPAQLRAGAQIHPAYALRGPQASGRPGGSMGGRAGNGLARPRYSGTGGGGRRGGPRRLRAPHRLGLPPPRPGGPGGGGGGGGAGRPPGGVGGGAGAAPTFRPVPPAVQERDHASQAEGGGGKTRTSGTLREAFGDHQRPLWGDRCGERSGPVGGARGAAPEGAGTGTGHGDHRHVPPRGTGRGAPPPGRGLDG
eukprot:381180-Pleurochrysis_carterae.AAC.2